LLRETALTKKLFDEIIRQKTITFVAAKLFLNGLTD